MGYGRTNVAVQAAGEELAFGRLDVAQQLARFFCVLDQAFTLPPAQREAMRNDFVRGIDALAAQGMPFAEILLRLDPRRLRGFYANSPKVFYPLDNGAKQYPLTMQPGQMAIFRLSATLLEPVIPSLLQLALTFALRRFSHYATRLRRGAFWFYLSPQPARYAVRRDDGVVCRPIDVSDETEQLFRVLYAGHRISVELFHILADGIGGMMFLKSLLAEYYRLQGEDVREADAQILDTEALPNAGDMENGFFRFRGQRHGDRLVAPPAVQLSAERLPGGGCAVDQYALSAAALRNAAHKYGITVTALMSAIILSACRQTSRARKGKYRLQVPVDLRRIFPSGTARNFSWYCALTSDTSGVQSTHEMAADLHRQLRAMTEKDALERNVSVAQRAIRWLRFVPLQWKTAFLRTAYRMTGDYFFTATLSNLGVVSLPEPLRSHLREMAAILGPSPTNPYIFAMVTVHDRAVLSVTRTTEDTALTDQLAECAREFGLELIKKG